MRFDSGEDALDPIDGGKDEGHAVAGHRHPIAKSAHQGFGGVSQCFQTRQSEEAAGALDGVDQAENVAEDFGIVRFLLKTHELAIDHVEAFVGLDQELLEKVVHCSGLCPGGTLAA
jgi:hypothetical protein